VGALITSAIIAAFFYLIWPAFNIDISDYSDQPHLIYLWFWVFTNLGNFIAFFLLWNNSRGRARN
jgi:hypothetical protein